jgi:hypothetical protein
MKVEFFEKSKKMPNLKAAASHPNIENFALYWVGPKQPVQSFLDTENGHIISPAVWGNPHVKSYVEFEAYAREFFEFITGIVDNLNTTHSE